MLRNSHLVREGDFFLIIYNGTDPAEVKSIYILQRAVFLGGVVHFSRDLVTSWSAEERLELLENEKRLAVELLENEKRLKEKAIREKEESDQRVKELEELIRKMPSKWNNQKVQ